MQKTFLYQKHFYAKNMPKIILRQIFLRSNIFWAKIFFTRNIFLGQKFLYGKNFVNAKKVLTP